MTIAMGVLCTDGVVLGVDLEYTQDISSYAGQKMFWLPKNLDAAYFVLIASSGNPDSTKTFVEILESELDRQIPGGLVTLRGLKSVIKDALRIVWREHIDVAPASERKSLGFDLLLGLRVGFEVYLYRSNRTMLIEERGAYCNGTGLYSGRPLADILLGPNPHIQVGAAAQVMAYIIYAAKEHTQYVGKGTDIHILPNRGLAYSLLNDERKQVEQDFNGLVRELRTCVSQLNGINRDHFYPSCLSRFGAAIETLRSNQEKRTKARSKRHSTVRVKRSNRLSTKGGVLSPLPSPESPGGSGES